MQLRQAGVALKAGVANALVRRHRQPQAVERHVHAVHVDRAQLLLYALVAEGPEHVQRDHAVRDGGGGDGGDGGFDDDDRVAAAIAGER